MIAVAPDLQSLAQISAERILNCTPEGIGIALLAWILLRAFGRQNSGTRFAVWFSALLGIAALPLLGHLGSHGAGLTKHSGVSVPASWAPYIFAGWLLVAAAGLFRIGVGFLRLQRLRNSCMRIEVAELDPLLRKTLQEFDSARGVAICVSDRIRVPTAIGFMRPLVVIPAWAMQELSTMELNTILLHELAHLRRWDDWTNLVQKILAALLFFHPAVWWIEKRLSLEREMACDDVVLAQRTSPRVYAECLVSLAEKSFLRRRLSLAQAAVDRMRHMSLRVSQILDVNRPGASRVWKPAPVLSAGISVVCLLIFSSAPKLVSFANSSAGAAATAPVVTKSPTVGLGNVKPSQVSAMGSPVVPTKLEVKAEAKRTGSADARPEKTAVVPAKLVQRRASPAMLIRASATDSVTSHQTLLLIVRSRQYDASGFTVWNVCIWQVSAVGPVRNRMEAGLIAKSI